MEIRSVSYPSNKGLKYVILFLKTRFGILTEIMVMNILNIHVIMFISYMIFIKLNVLKSISKEKEWRNISERLVQ